VQAERGGRCPGLAEVRSVRRRPSRVVDPRAQGLPGLFDRALHRFVELVEGGTGVALVLSGRDGDGALVVALLVEGVGPVLGGYPVFEGVYRVWDRAVFVEA